MAMTTRCPQCGTAFKVVADQLRVRNGLVRCGLCAAVFDGYACLATDAAAPPARRLPPAVFRNRADMRRNGVPDADGDAAGGPGQDPFADRAEDDAAHVARGRDDGAAAQDGEPAFDAPASGGSDPRDYRPWYGAADSSQDDASSDGALQDAAAGDDSSRDGLAVFGEPRRPGAQAAQPDPLAGPGPGAGLGRRLWGTAVVLGALLLAGQAAIVYRTPLADAAPALRPVLNALCAPFGCTVGYVRRLERIAIMSSSLQPVSAADADSDPMRLTLRVVLRNRYDQPQPWPGLILDLTDFSDTVVVRKALPPQAYLPPGLADGPFGAGREVGLSIPLQVSGARVNGYQLDKYFP